jgi:hypothetical protein
MPYEINTVTISKPMADILKKETIHATIHSTFKHSCNILWNTTLIGLVSPKLGNNPFSIVIDEKHPHILWPTIQIGTPVQLNTDQITIEKTVILNLTTATLWNPEIHLPTLHWEMAAHTLKQTLPFIPNPSLFLSTCHHFFTPNTPPPEHPSWLQKKLLQFLDLTIDHDSSPDTFTQATEQLIGLGPGLTPSGDDFLTGFVGLLTIYIKHSDTKNSGFSHKINELQLHVTHCVQDAIKNAKTTHVSIMALRGALEGWFSEPVRTLIIELLSPEKNKINKKINDVVSIGHSSGSDILAGIYSAIEMIHHGAVEK